MKQILCFIPIIGIFFIKVKYLENDWFFISTGAIQAMSLITLLHEINYIISYFIK